MTRHWTYGAVVALRYVPMGVLRWVKPVRVVEDSAQCIALYLAADTSVKRPVHRLTGEPIDRGLSFNERFSSEWWALGDGAWKRNSVLMLTRPGDAHSFWAFWRASDEAFLGWYVNLQEPLRRTSFGFDTADHVLDLVVGDDLSQWHWKDEDEFQEACAVGRFTADEQAAIRAEGERVLEIVRTRSWPLDGSWSEWEPDPTWTIPTFDTLHPDSIRD